MTGAPLSAFNYNSPVSFFVSQNPPDALKEEHPVIYAAFSELYNAMQQVILTFINNCGIGPQPAVQWDQIAGNPITVLCGNLRRFYVFATENIQLGAMVSLWNDGAGIKARNANATNNTKPMDAYCSSPAGILAGHSGEVTLSTGLAIINGLTPGQRYWLAISDGQVQNAPPVAAGNIEQYLGIALDTTHLYINAHYWIQH